MKLHEAMKACIDGNICRKSTTFENLTMIFDHDSGCFNIISDSGGRVSDFSYMGLVENWKLHKEQKFKVGQPVAEEFKNGKFTLGFICKYDEKTEEYAISRWSSDVGKFGILCQTKEENLISMSELAEKLGDK